MNQSNKIPARCLPLRWWGGALVQAVTGAPLVVAQFKGGRDPVVAGGERLVGSTESSLREWVNSKGNPRITRRIRPRWKKG